MTWSSAGSIATFPNETVPLIGATGTATQVQTKVGAFPAVPLTFRRDVTAGIVYVSGWWDANTGSGTELWATSYRLPVLFRPKSPGVLTFRAWNLVSATPPAPTLVFVGTNGSLPAAAAVQSSNTNYTLTGFYLTDV